MIKQLVRHLSLPLFCLFGKHLDTRMLNAGYQHCYTCDKDYHEVLGWISHEEMLKRL